MAVILAFTAEQVASLTGLSVHQLHYWDSTDFFHPSFQDEAGKPYGRIYSFRDVVSLRVLSLLRNDYRVSLQELRKVGDWLANQPEDSWAISKFYVTGRHVYFYDPRSEPLRQGARPQQTVIPVEIQAVIADTECRARKLQDRDEEEIGRIFQHRYIAHNEPVLAGTRIRTSAIWNFHRAGYSTKEILDEYPRLTETDIEAAIDYESRQRQAAA
ncbi:MAG: DUF433 domain-containing protein [Candidatus Binatia bacterium]